jgi:hypothetical protein
MSEEQETPGVSAGAAPNPEEGDGESKAMQLVVAALKPLTEEKRRRVLDYVLGRFGILPIQPVIVSPITAAASPSIAAATHAAAASSGPIHDIRSLKEAKVPKIANEMAALVAFYVSELAPACERRNAITRTDRERYIKSAGSDLSADATSGAR